MKILTSATKSSESGNVMNHGYAIHEPVPFKTSLLLAQLWLQYNAQESGHVNVICKIIQ